MANKFALLEEELLDRQVGLEDAEEEDWGKEEEDEEEKEGKDKDDEDEEEEDKDETIV
jgi:hypothetical protein